MAFICGDGRDLCGTGGQLWKARFSAAHTAPEVKHLHCYHAVRPVVWVIDIILSDKRLGWFFMNCSLIVMRQALTSSCSQALPV